MDPVLTALFVSFAANVASDLVHDGIGWLARNLKTPTPTTAVAVPELNTRIQAALRERGAGQRASVATADYLLATANLSHLLLLANTAQQHRDGAERDGQTRRLRTYAVDFEAEVRAHLVLEAGLDPEDDDTGLVASTVAEMLAAVAARQIAFGGAMPPALADARPSALFLYRNASERGRQFEALGRPDLNAYLEYTRLYNSAAESHFGEIQLQHLGATTPALPIDKIYVQPSFRRSTGFGAVSPVTGDTSSLQRAALGPAGEIGMRTALSGAQRKVFLGPAGIGKSTFVRFTASRIAQLGANGTVAPFVIELRRLAHTGMFTEHILEQVKELCQAEPPSGWLQYMLMTGRAVVLFDGFDEVLDLGERSVVRDAIRGFAELYVASDVIVTSRINGYDAAPFPRNEFQAYEVQKFDEPRIKSYAGKWFQVRDRVADTTAFMAETRKHAYELRQNPLMLSLLCNVYYYRGDIPKTLFELYERCAAMMFQEWDSIRGIENLGAYDNNIRHSLHYLANLILNNPTYRGTGMPRETIERELVKHWRSKSVVGLGDARAQARRVVDLWTGRAWIITAVGADERNSPLFGFVHQSFLEFFAATQIHGSSYGPDSLLSNLVPRILRLNGWPVAQMAVYIFDYGHESGGSDFLRCLIAESERRPSAERYTLLLFAIELLASLKEVAPQVQSDLIGSVLESFAASIILPVEGQGLWSLHEETRMISLATGRDDELEGDDEHEEYEDDAKADSSPPAILSSLETERLISALLGAYVDNVAGQKLIVAVLGKWRPHCSADAALSAGVFLAAMLSDMYPAIAEAASVSIGRLATRLEANKQTWLFDAALVAANKLDFHEAGELLPWNTQFVRESLVLSLNFTVDVPSVVPEKVLQLLTESSNLGWLQSLGRSLLANVRSSKDWDAIDLYDFGLLGIEKPGMDRDSAIDTTGWDSDAFAGAVLVLGVILEAFGDDGLPTCVVNLDSERAQICVVEAGGASTAGPALEIQRRWNAGTLRFTGRQEFGR